MTDVFNNTFPGDGTSFAKLFRWLGAIAGKTADTATRTEINATTAGATFNETEDSLEALRDQQVTDTAALQTEVNKIPRKDTTHRWTNTETGKTASVEITEDP